VIETLASAQVERGISIERFNMRGVFGKAIGEGGDQERALAKQTREWAEASAGSVRTRAMLEHIAQSWDRDAERSDTETQQNALRF
jgi:alpha/beta superfamily hydrolase